MFVVIPSPADFVSSFDSLVVYSLRELTDEEDHILSPLFCRQRTYGPVGDGLLGTSISREGDHIVAWLIQSHAAVDLGGYVDDRRILRILCEQVLIPFECPLLQRRLRLLEERCNALCCSSSLLLDGDGELLVWHASVICLASVLRRVNLETDVELLTR